MQSKFKYFTGLTSWTNATNAPKQLKIHDRVREEERDDVRGLSLLFRHSLHLSTTDSSLLPSCSIFNFQPFLPRLFRNIFYPPKSFVLSFSPHLCHHFPSLPLLFHLPTYLQKTLLRNMPTDRDLQRQSYRKSFIFHESWPFPANMSDSDWDVAALNNETLENLWPQAMKVKVEEQRFI